ncbi:unnamed protein product [Rhizoctonia solani]|uniref:Uncharacterized protein n=1 Tax=Rhizoctonia solani TaxID=456999 RepID=A0A8H3H872_9AGAM|nr:unnamed protein product [Rhizoctonia solani]
MPPTSRSHKSTKSASKVEEVTDGVANLKIRSKATASKAEATTKQESPADKLRNSMATASKAEATTKQESPADKLRNSMVTINEASQTLSSAVKSGWKLGSEGDSEWSLGKISKAIESVPGALTTLRAVYKEQGKTEKLVDVERAALGIVSKLNGLRVYTLSLDLLGAIRTGILSLLGVEEVEERPKSRSARSKSSTQPTHINLLRLPVLSSSTPPQPLQVALATFQAHSIKAVLATLTHTHLEELHGLLTSPEFSLTRSPPTSGALPTEQLSTLYVGTFQALAASGALSPPPTPAPTTTTTTRSTRAPSATRKTSGSSKSAPAAKSCPVPEELALLVRKQALLILARSPSLEKDTNLFWDQALKWGAIYVKSVSASPSPPTESQITQTLSQFFMDLVSSVPVRGPRFEAMCEWWMRFAKKTKDTELIRRISGLLQGSEDEPRTPTKTHSADTKAPPLPETKTIPSETRQTPAALLATLDRASLSTDPGDMNAAAGALLTLSRNTTADSSLPQRVSDLRKACAKCWAKDKDASRRVVEAIVICAQVPDFPPELTVSAVDALLTLSRNELNTGDYETYEKASEGVGKALKLAEAFATRSDAPDQNTHPTLLRAISNTGYTLAGALYNATRATQAIGFVQQSCLVGEQALALADAQPGGSKDKEIVALRDHMPRRWELLAICRLKSTDRRGAVEAYGKALVWYIALLPPSVETEKLDDKTNHLKSTDRRGAVEAYGKALVWYIALLPPSVETEKLDDKTNHLVSQLVAISVGELFDPESVLLSRLFANLDVDDKVVCLMMERVVKVVCLMMERVVKVLEDMMHKPIAQKAMELVVEELGRLWGDEHPIKRAKLLISLLKHEYHASGPTVKVSPEEVLELLSTGNLKRDAQFKSHVAEYIAQTHIWSALLLHKSNAPTTESSGPAVKVSPEEVLELLSTGNLKRDAQFKPHVAEYIAQTHIWSALLLHKSNAPTTEVATQASAASEKLLEMVNPVVEPVSAKSAGKKPVGRTRSVSRRTAKDKETALPKDSNKPPAPLVLDDRTGLVQSMGKV